MTETEQNDLSSIGYVNLPVMHGKGERPGKRSRRSDTSSTTASTSSVSPTTILKSDLCDALHQVIK